MENPLYERPRGLTVIEKSLRSQGYRLWALLLVALSTLGLVIAGVEITKEVKTSNGLLMDTKHNGLSTYQALTTLDMDTLILADGQAQALIPEMNSITLTTGNTTRGFQVVAWEVAPTGFTIQTALNHTLEFDGTTLAWDGWPISEVQEEPTDNRALLGWKDGFAKVVKKKLDSPLCNTEALVEKVRGLKLVTAPACHVGVSGAKIYMHYTQ